MKLKYYSVLSLCVLGGLLSTPASVWAAQQTEITISSASVLNPSAVEVVFSNQQRMTLDFYGENIFRMFQDNQGGIVRDPQASPEAQILVDRPRKEVADRQGRSDYDFYGQNSDRNGQAYVAVQDYG